MVLDRARECNQNQLHGVEISGGDTSPRGDLPWKK